MKTYFQCTNLSFLKIILKLSLMLFPCMAPLSCPTTTLKSNHLFAIESKRPTTHFISSIQTIFNLYSFVHTCMFRTISSIKQRSGLNLSVIRTRGTDMRWVNELSILAFLNIKIFMKSYYALSTILIFTRRSFLKTLYLHMHH